VSTNYQSATYTWSGDTTGMHSVTVTPRSQSGTSALVGTVDVVEVVEMTRCGSRVAIRLAGVMPGMVA